MVFTLASFVTDEHLTISIRDHRAFGDIAMSYVTRAEGTERTRLLGKVIAVLPRNLLGAAMRRLLPAGDLVMMRRQLLNLKLLAEATTIEAREARS